MKIGNGVFKLARTMRLRPLTNSSRHAEFISSSYCLHSFSVFPIGNTPFVHIVYSSTTHVNGYSFRLDISYGNISFVLRTHRVCKENHSCLRQISVMQNLFQHLIIYMFTFTVLLLFIYICFLARTLTVTLTGNNRCAELVTACNLYRIRTVTKSHQKYVKKQLRICTFLIII